MSGFDSPSSDLSSNSSRVRARRSVYSISRDVASPNPTPTPDAEVNSSGLHGASVQTTLPIFSVVSSIQSTPTRPFVPPPAAKPLPTEIFVEDEKREEELLTKFKKENDDRSVPEESAESGTISPSSSELEAMTQEERDQHFMPPPPPPGSLSGWAEMLSVAPALAEPWAAVYITSSVDELITRVLFVLRRDRIRQKDLATSINLSGSTLSPMLRGKYRHTKDAHITKLREWLYQRDKLFCAAALHQAVRKGLAEDALAEALGLSRPLLARWLRFGLPFPQRTTVDEHLLAWAGPAEGVPDEDGDSGPSSQPQSPMPSPVPANTHIGSAGTHSRASSPLAPMEPRLHAGLWRLPPASSTSSLPTHSYSHAYSHSALAPPVLHTSTAGLSLATGSLSGGTSPYAANAPSAASPSAFVARARSLSLPSSLLAHTHSAPQSHALHTPATHGSLLSAPPSSTSLSSTSLSALQLPTSPAAHLAHAHAHAHAQTGSHTASSSTVSLLAAAGIGFPPATSMLPRARPASLSGVAHSTGALATNAATYSVHGDTGADAAAKRRRVSGTGEQAAGRDHSLGSP